MSTTKKTESLQKLLALLDNPIETLPETTNLSQFAHIDTDTEGSYTVTLFNPYGPIQVEIKPQWVGGPSGGPLHGKKMSQEEFDEWQDRMWSEVCLLARTIALVPWLSEYVLSVANGELSNADNIRAEAERLFTKSAMMDREGWSDIAPYDLNVRPEYRGFHTNQVTLWGTVQGDES